MPFRYQVSKENRTITIIGSGVGTMQERSDCVDAILHDEKCCPGYSILIDVSCVVNSPTADEARAIVELLNKLQSRYESRTAIFNTCAGNVTISCIIALLAAQDPGRIRAFMSDKDAREWLTYTAN
jgi:hypothetical protein